jgi:peptidoglycan/xylan/chitin deacetylase (PgdA/CDA1 family)
VLRFHKTARRLIRHLWIYFLYCTGLVAWARRRVMASGGIIVLTLHRVLDEEDYRNTGSPRGMVMRSTTYEALLRHLSRECEIVSVTGLVPSRTSQTARPRFALTFDDGWKDTFAVAYPLSERFDAPIAVFVCPGLAGRQDPFWPEQVLRAWRVAAGSTESRQRFAEICAETDLCEGHDTEFGNVRAAEILIERLKELEPPERGRIVGKLSAAANTNRGSGLSAPQQMEATMTWDETTQMANRGAQIGSHTFNHEILTTLTAVEVDRELTDSKRSIESVLGKVCGMFAYPSGLWSQEIRDLVVRAGHTEAFLNEPGVWKSDTDRWLIPRTNLWEGSVVGLSGRFSRVVFEYATFWRSYRAGIPKREKPDQI